MILGVALGLMAVIPPICVHLLRTAEYSRREEAFWIPVDREVTQVFVDHPLPDEERYRWLFRYFITGFVRYRARDGAHAAYPGAPSHHGSQVDAMEGVTRVMPLMSAWISSGRDRKIKTLDGRAVDLLQIVKEGLISGTDEGSPGYWGHIGAFDQRACEAADVALSLWLLRSSLWAQLDRSCQQRIVSWLTEVNRQRVPDNNWHLFPVLVNLVLRSLGEASDESALLQHYQRFKSLYRGEGWFSDGPKDRYDYYNAWGMHYALFWISRIDPGFDRNFIGQASSAFVRSYRYLFSPAGIPITGRSICYRLAAPAPLIGGAIQDPPLISPGMARRALNCTWRYFIGNGALSRGNVTQGYCGDDLRFLENYSGPASCLWSLRSLTLAFYCPPHSDFWRSPEEALPIETADYDLFLPSIGWRVIGLKANQEVAILRTDYADDRCGPIEGLGLFRRLAQIIRGQPYRPDNDCVKYRLPRYSAKNPFCGCARRSSR